MELASGTANKKGMKATTSRVGKKTFFALSPKQKRQHKGTSTAKQKKEQGSSYVYQQSYN